MEVSVGYGSDPEDEEFLSHTFGTSIEINYVAFAGGKMEWKIKEESFTSLTNDYTIQDFIYLPRRTGKAVKKTLGSPPTIFLNAYTFLTLF